MTRQKILAISPHPTAPVHYQLYLSDIFWLLQQEAKLKTLFPQRMGIVNSIEKRKKIQKHFRLVEDVYRPDYHNTAQNLNTIQNTTQSHKKI